VFHYCFNSKGSDRVGSTAAGRPLRFFVAMCKQWLDSPKTGLPVVRRRSHLMTASVALVVLMNLPSCTQAQGQTEPTVPTSPLLGGWSMTTMTASGEETIDPAQPGLFIFTEGHYSAVYSLGADPRPLSAAAFDPTSDEMVAQYQTIIVNTGTYEANGSTITFRPIVAKSPEFIGGHSTMDYQINGDVLTLTITSTVAASGVSAPDAPASSMMLRRIE